MFNIFTLGNGFHYKRKIVLQKGPYKKLFKSQQSKGGKFLIVSYLNRNL